MKVIPTLVSIEYTFLFLRLLQRIFSNFKQFFGRCRKVYKKNQINVINPFLASVPILHSLKTPVHVVFPLVDF